MIVSSIFNRRYRGFRVIDLVALTILLLVALTSYALKTFAQGVGADTSGIEQQITLEQRRIHLLKAEIAHLDDPDRIERLSTQYLGMQPTDPKQEATVEALPTLKAAPPAKPKKP